MIAIEAISKSVLPAIAEIEAELFENRCHCQHSKACLMARHLPASYRLRTRVAGYVLAHLTQDQVEILSLGTARQYQRRGHASLLLTALISTVPDTACFLEVAADNKAARDLYIKNGFVEVGSRSGYYRRGQRSCDAVVMRRG